MKHQALKLMVTLLLVSGPTLADQEANSEEMLLNTPTTLESLISEGKYNDALSLFDETTVKLGMAYDLNVVKANALSIRRMIGGGVAAIDPRQQAVNRIFEAIAVDMQDNINTIKSPEYDIKPSIIKELTLSSDPSCKVEKSIHGENLSIIYNCQNSVNGYSISTTDKDPKVTRILSGYLEGIKTKIHEISVLFENNIQA